MDTVQTGMILVVTAALCVAASYRLSLLRRKLWMLLPSLLCLLGAAVCLALYEKPVYNFDYSSLYLIIILGISFVSAFFAGAVTVCVVFLKQKLFSRNNKR